MLFRIAGACPERSREIQPASCGARAAGPLLVNERARGPRAEEQEPAVRTNTRIFQAFIRRRRPESTIPRPGWW